MKSIAEGKQYLRKKRIKMVEALKCVDEVVGQVAGIAAVAPIKEVTVTNQIAQNVAELNISNLVPETDIFNNTNIK